MEPILEVTGLCKRYPGFALEQVSFSVQPGTVMGLIGRNGAGKTTTIRSILRLVHPDAGTVRLLGQNIAENERALRQALGYAAGGTVCYPRRRVGEIAAVTARFFENWDEGRYQSLLERFALGPGKRLAELSEGMKRKLSLALAMSHHARLLLLDEPTSGLDPVSREELLDLFRQLAGDGTAIVFSTHITTDLERCADEITYLKQGRVVASKEKAAFLADYPGCATLDDVMLRLERKEDAQ